MLLESGNTFQVQMELLGRIILQPDMGMFKCRTELEAIFKFDFAPIFLGEDLLGGKLYETYHLQLHWNFRIQRRDG